jgi:hypothetical protein
VAQSETDESSSFYRGDDRPPDAAMDGDDRRHEEIDAVKGTVRLPAPAVR